MDCYQALVLAGRRGVSDPLAEREGTSHRALLDVAGVPMLLRVVRTLRASPRIGRIAISIDEPAVLDSIPELREAILVRNPARLYGFPGN